MNVTDEMVAAYKAAFQAYIDNLPARAPANFYLSATKAGLEAAISAAPEAPQCCMCGKTGLSTKEGDGGAECELNDGRWVCSAECWDKAVGDAAPEAVRVKELEVNTDARIEMVSRALAASAWKRLNTRDTDFAKMKYPDGEPQYVKEQWPLYVVDAHAALSALEVDKPTHRHKKRGSVYTVIANGVLQVDADLDNEKVVIYRGEDGRYWVRPEYEFNDGRFEALATTEGK
ncbi:MAG: hypothetical protein QMD99_19250 [Rhizobiaceae bacterium]|nr:hypothetical protein [Rhizobiaceae bacterium]